MVPDSSSAVTATLQHPQAIPQLTTITLPLIVSSPPYNNTTATTSTTTNTTSHNNSATNTMNNVPATTTFHHGNPTASTTNNNNYVKLGRADVWRDVDVANCGLVMGDKANVVTVPSGSMTVDGAGTAAGHPQVMVATAAAPGPQAATATMLQERNLYNSGNRSPSLLCVVLDD